MEQIRRSTLQIRPIRDHGIPIEMRAATRQGVERMRETR